MNKEYLKSIIDCVSGIECKHETQQIAKYELIEHVEDLQDRINKAINVFEECKMLFPHEFSWEEQVDNVLEILKGDSNDNEQ